MILFNWNKVMDISRGNSSEIYKIIKTITKAELPKNRYDPIYRYSQINFRGNSFLLHPDVLLSNAYLYSKREIAQYIALASFRSMAEYLTEGKTWLDMHALPVDVEQLDDNRLLILDYDNSRVIFRYEEVPQEKH